MTIAGPTGIKPPTKKQLLRIVRANFVLPYLPVPDRLARARMRRMARALAVMPVWPDMQAQGADAARLAMLRLLGLQRQTHRAVRWRHREASVMLARSSLEIMLLGLYCLWVPGVVPKLNAAHVKASGNTVTFLRGVDPALDSFIDSAVGSLGQPGPYPRYGDIADQIDKVPGRQRRPAPV